MNTVSADAFFGIGTQHVRSGLPCEDYALAHAAPGYAYAIVSDGCSSGGQTDVGARLVAHVTARAIADTYEAGGPLDADAIQARVLVLQREGRVLLSLREHDMLATLAIAYVSPIGGFVRIVGDGAVVCAYDDGSMQLSRFTWDGNMPYYPSYADGSHDAFIAAQGGDLAQVRLTEERCLVRSGMQTCTSVPYTLAEGMQGITLRFGQDELAHMRMVGVFSDGVTQVQGVPWVQAVRDLVAFKSLAGAFLKRRMIRQLKTYEQGGTEPYDDVAGAVLMSTMMMGE